ncbi:SAM-dependent methyltransferase [Paludibacter sp.]
MSGVLYLFPVELGESKLKNIIPEYNIELISSIKFFIVEDIRTARRFLKRCNSAINIDEIEFFVLNKHTEERELMTFITPLKRGCDVGLLSEAGCPAIADPGADIVAMAQSADIKVVPLVGPSSILLSLMASGFNGQSFAFNGYLPIQEQDKIKTLKLFEKRIYSENQTQIFIETPYRNNKIIQEIIKHCQPLTKLCIAANITLENEFIKTKTLNDWKKSVPDLQKHPCIFLLYK